MIQINGNELKTVGTTDIQLADAMMILDYLYDEIEAEFGTRAAEKILQRMPKRVIRKKRKEKGHGQHHNT